MKDNVKFNQYQLNAIYNNDKNIVCIAGAGSGKTTVMLERIKRLISDGVSPDSILCLTFTRTAALNMESRYKSFEIDSDKTPMFSTFHAFCYQLLIADAKIRAYLGYTDIPSIASDQKIKIIDSTVKSELGMKSKKSNSLKDKYMMDLYNTRYKYYLKSNNIISFDILLEEVCNLFVNDNPIIKKYKSQINYILVDEFQDTDQIQFDFISSFKDSNIFVVGDISQCHPAGTKIKLEDGSNKLIEDIRIGDTVITYNESSNSYNIDGCQVSEISKRYSQNIVSIQTANYISRYTKDHLTYARFNLDKNKDKYIMYFIYDEHEYGKLGCSKIYYTLYDMYFTDNIYNHIVDDDMSKRVKLWILGVYESKSAVFKDIYSVSNKFGITYLHSHYTDKESVIKLLEKFDRKFEYPIVSNINLLYTIVQDSKNGTKPFLISVCNLIPELFDLVVPVYNNKHNRYETTYENIIYMKNLAPAYVYGLSVNIDHNYIADGILTHNCIYSFRGASNSIMKMIMQDSQWTNIELPINYRSTKEICDYANDLTDKYNKEFAVKLESYDKHGVEIDEKFYTQSYNKKLTICPDMMNSLIDLLSTEYCGTTAILCRTNIEVQYLRKYLSMHDIQISDNNYGDIENVLKSSISDEYYIEYMLSIVSMDVRCNILKYHRLNNVKITVQSIKEFIEKNSMANEMYILVDRLRLILNSDEIPYDKITMICNAIGYMPKVNISTNAYTNDEIIQYLLSIINIEDTKSTIYVGTIHSVKGLEFDRVIIINVDGRMFKLKDDDTKNLFYVAITRAKKDLHVWYEMTNN